MGCLVKSAFPSRFVIRAQKMEGTCCTEDKPDVQLQIFTFNTKRCYYFNFRERRFLMS